MAAGAPPSLHRSETGNPSDSLWDTFHVNAPPALRYEVIAGPGCAPSALRLERLEPRRFRYHASKWEKFPGEESDNIVLGGFNPVNLIRGRNILFVANFENNDVTLQQFHAMIVLLQSFIESLTVVLAFYPVGTMEIVTQEGTVATANTMARLFAGLPSCGKPIRLVLYDLHTLQNRFYFAGHVIGDLCSAIPLLRAALAEGADTPADEAGALRIDAIAFPDAGAAKRFGKKFPEYAIITCAKVRSADNLSRVVTVAEGDARGKNVLIVDDLVRTGGTLAECGKALREQGAKSVSAFCSHAVFPAESWRRFLRGGDRAFFDAFLVTNSIPSVTAKLPTDDCFKVLELEPQMVLDL